MKPPPITLPVELAQRVRDDMAAIVKGLVPDHQTFAPLPQKQALQSVSFAVQRGDRSNGGLGSPRAPGLRLRQDGLPDFWITP